MENKYFYPSEFHKADEGGFWVSFPDFPECFTQGENIAEAYEMAVDALGLAIEDRIKENNIPAPTEPDHITLSNDSYLVIVEFDLLDYRIKHSSEPVKKTLSIPRWLNEEAIRQGINFSAILQNALKEQLGISEKQ